MASVKLLFKIHVIGAVLARGHWQLRAIEVALTGSWTRAPWVQMHDCPKGPRYLSTGRLRFVETAFSGQVGM